MRYVIAYDLGTSSLKASLIDENMNIVSEAVEPYKDVSYLKNTIDKIHAELEKSGVGCVDHFAVTASPCFLRQEPVSSFAIKTELT